MDEQMLRRCIERINAGDVEAAGAAFEALEGYVRIAVRRRLDRRIRARLDSRDVVQSAFADALLGILRGGWRFAGPAQLLGLLKRIATRKVVDRYRKHETSMRAEQPLGKTSPGELPATDQPGPIQEAEGREFRDRILRACPAPHREIIRLRMEGFRIGEIAERTGLHEGSVRRIIHGVARELSLAPRIACRSRRAPDRQGTPRDG